MNNHLLARESEEDIEFMVNTIRDDISKILIEMEKCVVFDYIGTSRHAIYPNITYFINCMNTLFELVTNNASILGYSFEQYERLYDIERNDNREFILKIKSKEQFAKKIKDDNEKAYLYEEIVEIMQQKVTEIKNLICS